MANGNGCCSEPIHSQEDESEDDRQLIPDSRRPGKPLGLLCQKKSYTTMEYWQPKSRKQQQQN
jgi:hypothetical protein